VTLERNDASARLSDYLKREAGASTEEADRRAEELVSVLVGGPGAVTFAPITALAHNWWLFALRGLLAVIFGVLTLVQPAAAFTAIVLVFGVWAFIDGINALALAITGWRSWQLALAGLVGIALGLLTFFRPGFTAIGLYAAVAAWAVARGILEIAVGIELRKRVKGELWLVFAGIASLLFGVLMIALPMAGLLALAWLIGIYALMFGVLMFALSVRLSGLRPGRQPQKQPLGVPTPRPA
jgi:uncharacterized membrane protein HdeD (DUF308 family)